jgi:ribonuclease T1
MVGPEAWRGLAAAFFLALAALGAARGAQTASGDVQSRDLPPEARQTLQLIERGGPYSYARDGAVFRNYERLLPLRARDYYREYTVPTPGSRDRGARRIVTGAGGERYYTDDHYRTFQRIRE